MLLSVPDGDDPVAEAQGEVLPVVRPEAAVHARRHLYHQPIGVFYIVSWSQKKKLLVLTPNGWFPDKISSFNTGNIRVQ